MYSADFFKNPIQSGRSLTAEEHELRLKQKEWLADYDENQPHYNLAVIQQNSTFVDLTDRNYPVRGIATALGIFAVGLFGWMLSFTLFGKNVEFLDVVLSLLIIILPLYFCFHFIFLRESFSHTHYPIRLNRRNRTVYIWRKNEQTLAVPWDKVFFCLRGYSDMGGKTWDIRGYILEDDGITVKDSFPFSSYSSSDANDLRQHFEYFRRYMENGPEQAHRMLKICLPIATRRETWWEGFMRLLLNMNGWPLFQIIFSPFYFICSLGRWVAMHTSKIPQWPQWVEQECAIDADDPYRRDSGWEAAKESTGKSAAA